MTFRLERSSQLTHLKEAATPSKRARLGSDNGEHIRIKSEDEEPADSESRLLKGMLLHLKCLTICRHMLELSEEVSGKD